MGSNPSKQSVLESDLKVCPICQPLPTGGALFGADRLGRAVQWASLLCQATYSTVRYHLAREATKFMAEYSAAVS
jgi:hypothetical protein